MTDAGSSESSVVTGQPEQARDLLAETYGWLTEGQDTHDLKEAAGLLAELERRTARAADER